MFLDFLSKKMNEEKIEGNYRIEWETVINFHLI